MTTDSSPRFYWMPPQLVSQPCPFHYLEFRLDGYILQPSDLAGIELPRELDAQRSAGLMLSGKGPLWLYAHLAHLAHTFAWVAVYDPRLAGGVVVQRHVSHAPQLGEVVPFPVKPDPPSPPGPHSRPELCWVTDDVPHFGPIATLQLTPPGGGRVFLPADLANLALPESSGPPPALIRLSGQFPVWLLTCLAAKLRDRFPGTPLAVYQPTLAGAVVFTDPQPGLVVPDRPRSRPVPLFALIGDPNSGKSVLSWKLYHTFKAQGLKVYRLDCDASAPTAGWALAGETGRDLRQDYKKQRGGWRQEDVDALVRAVRFLQHADLDLALLDLPGGLHQEGANPDRIPKGREGLFELVDGFVLLQRDERARDGWMRALEKYHLETRIAAAVTPVPDGSKSEVLPDVNSPLPAWTIQQLDRAAVETLTNAVQSLAGYLVSRLPQATAS